MVASFYSKKEALSLLLENGANPLLKDITGDFALSYAIRSGVHECMTILLKYYVEKDLYQENNLGLTLLDLAILKLQSNFYSHKVNSIGSDINVDISLIKNYQDIHKKGNKRKLPSTDEVRELTYYFLELSNDIREKQKLGIVTHLANDIMSSGPVEHYRPRGKKPIYRRRNRGFGFGSSFF